MSKIVDISEAKTQLDELLTLAIQGTEVIIVQDEQPLVRLVPAVTSQRASFGGATLTRVAGLHKGEGWISEDFNDPLPDQFWAAIHPCVATLTNVTREYYDLVMSDFQLQNRVIF